MLDGKNAFVIGTGSGIDREIAKLYSLTNLFQ